MKMKLKQALCLSALICTAACGNTGNNETSETTGQQGTESSCKSENGEVVDTVDDCLQDVSCFELSNGKWCTNTKDDTEYCGIGIVCESTEVCIDGECQDKVEGPACRGYTAYSVNLSVPCKVSETTVDLGCLECSSPDCSGLTAIGCFLTTDKSVVVITDTIQEPDPLLEMGWIPCSEEPATSGDFSIDELPLCE